MAGTSRILGDELRAAGKSEKDIEKLDLKDDVLRRANGFYTYFAADIAYHRNKFDVRGFDRVINIWGADHHGHVARLKGALDALGLDGQHRLDIVLMQLVKLMRDGEVVRMSKRTGKAISLARPARRDTRGRGALVLQLPRRDTQMDFDLGLAVREDSARTRSTTCSTPTRASAPSYATWPRTATPCPDAAARGRLPAHHASRSASS